MAALVGTGSSIAQAAAPAKRFEQVNGDAIRTAAYIKTANTTTGAWDFVTVQSVE